MAVYEQKPGPMSLVFRRGDSFGTLIDFDPTSLAGYTVTATITSTVTGLPVQAMTTTIADASAGKVNVGLTSAQTAALAAGTYVWTLAWVDAANLTRTALQGTVEVLP